MGRMISLTRRRNGAPGSPKGSDDVDGYSRDCLGRLPVSRRGGIGKFIHPLRGHVRTHPLLPRIQARDRRRHMAVPRRKGHRLCAFGGRSGLAGACFHGTCVRWLPDRRRPPARLHLLPFRPRTSGLAAFQDEYREAPRVPLSFAVSLEAVRFGIGFGIQKSRAFPRRNDGRFASMPEHACGAVVEPGPGSRLEIVIGNGFAWCFDIARLRSAIARSGVPAGVVG